MSWGAGGRHLDEMLHVAAVADAQRHAETRRAAALTIAAHLGTGCRDVLAPQRGSLVMPWEGHVKIRNINPRTGD